MRTLSISLRFAAVSIALLSTSAAALAGDRYVDALTGSNANDGLGAGTAWRTLTYALGQLAANPPTADTIHIAPGVYDPGLGEQYPLHVRPLIRLVGTQGSAVTVLDGGGSLMLVYEVNTSTQSYSYDAASSAEGLTLRNGSTGLLVHSTWNPASPAFRDLDIVAMSGDGVSIMTNGGVGGHFASPTFDRVTIHDCQIGIDLSASYCCSPPGNGVTASLTDCSIRGCHGHGISLTEGISYAEVDLVRCRITDNAGDGILATGGNGPFSGTRCSARTCLIAGNQGRGIEAPSVGSGWSNFSVVDCTVAGNLGAGLDIHSTASLRNSIFYANGDDVALGGSISASYCDCGDGDLDGYPNCFSSNPLFADAAAGDYRLRWGSPCIETGDPATPHGSLDLAGNARPIDGDLDTHEQPDRGCFEFAPLFLITSGQIGTPLALELWGPSGGTTTVYFSRLALVPPSSTAFGDFDLNPASVGTLLTSSVGSGPPVVFHRPIPGNPALIGRTFSFQALTSSAAAPQGFAYTNAVSVTITP